MSTIIASNLQASGGTGTAATLASINGGPIAGSRQRLINGDFRIDQRNAGASVTIGATTSVYTLDRWACQSAYASKFSVQQNAGSITPPAGFSHYAGITSLSAYSSAAGDYFSFYQTIEGFNTVDLAWGTSSAQSITVSFWVRCSLTGTHSASVCNFDGSRAYVFTYTVNSANAWEYKSITIPGATTGTWLTTSQIGASIRFDLGCGSSFRGTAGSWGSSNLYGATGAVSVIGTNGATWQITGVQIEAGTVATPFERRSYGQELMLCQRYFCKPNGGGGSGYGRSHGYDLGTNRGPLYLPLPATMRATPSITITSPYTINDGGSPFGYGATVVAGGDPGQIYFFVTFTSQPPAGSMVSFGGNCTASAEL